MIDKDHKKEIDKIIKNDKRIDRNYLAFKKEMMKKVKKEN